MLGQTVAMARTLLTEDEIAELLAEFGEWRRDGDRLCRTYEFANFIDAFGFMAKVAVVSEKLFHHPEWSNVYNRVDIAITDHAAGGISNNDRAWIERVEQL